MESKQWSVYQETTLKFNFLLSTQGYPIYKMTVVCMRYVWPWLSALYI